MKTSLLRSVTIHRGIEKKGGAGKEEGSREVFLIYLKIEEIAVCLDDNENHLERGKLLVWERKGLSIRTMILCIIREWVTTGRSRDIVDMIQVEI